MTTLSDLRASIAKLIETPCVEGHLRDKGMSENTARRIASGKGLRAARSVFAFKRKSVEQSPK